MSGATNSSKHHRNENQTSLDEIKEKIGHPFEVEENLITALTRPALKNERSCKHHEGWPTFGDALWGAGVKDMLFHARLSGEDIHNRAQNYIPRSKQVEIAINMDLQRYILTTQGERDTVKRFVGSYQVGQMNDILSGTFEAVICGIYLDEGLERSR